MNESGGIESRYQTSKALLQRRGQGHVLRWWDELDQAKREALLADIEAVPWEVLDPLIPALVLNPKARAVPHDLAPPKVYPHVPEPSQVDFYTDSIATGREMIRAGKVAALTVAGGQGSRLGVDGPKGAVVVTPVGERTLFQLFAEALAATCQRYDTVIPWYIMTSPANHGQTLDFFRAHDYFGLPEADVIMFTQGVLPAMDREGRLLLQEKHRLALAPDGHGGTLKALVAGGALRDMQTRGVEVISYFQVDNPLVTAVDPLFIGLHAKTGSEMSTKVTPKADDVERVGNVCLCDGRVTIIEYSDLPDELAHARTAEGHRKFNAGNLAIHLLDVAFVDRVIAQSLQMPFRRADKVVPYVGADGSVVKPTSPNAVKLEAFVFDVLPLAQNALVFEVDRAEEFSPVKNATGVDSLETSQRDQVRRACRWLESAGVEVPRDGNGEPAVTVVIGPSFALDAEGVRTRVAEVPRLKPGDAIYLA